MLETLERTFQENVRGLFTPVEKWQQAAWDRFLELGLPTREHEDFRRIRLRDLYTTTYKTQGESPVATGEATLVFIDGRFRPELSKELPKEWVCLPLKEAKRTYGAFLMNRWHQESEELDPFLHLNRAMASDALFLYIPPRCRHDFPLRLLHIVTGDEPLLVAPRLHLLLGRESTLKLSLELEQEGETAHGINEMIDVVVEEGASCFLQVVRKKPSVSWHMQHLRSHVKRRGVFRALTLGGGNALFRQVGSCTLQEEEAEAQFWGAFPLDGKNEAHISHTVVHEAMRTRSLQKIKSGLLGKSRFTFIGKIEVFPAALLTEAYQLNNNLLLSKNAQVYSKPTLEIGADDVKASHGSTTGELDEESLFYFKSRGISKQTAREMLLKGFFQEIYDLEIT